jgi:hypothetical protein
MHFALIVILVLMIIVANRARRRQIAWRRSLQRGAPQSKRGLASSDRLTDSAD